MAKGQTIEKLYVSIGLNADDLKVGFEQTDKTISQQVQKLNNDAKNIKLKMDVDLSRIESTGSELDKLKIKAEALQRQLQIATQKQSISQQTYDIYNQKYGADNSLTSKAERVNLYRQKDVIQLQNELKKVNSEIDKVSPKATSAFSKVSSGAKNAASSVTNLTGGISAFNAKFAGILAVVGTGAGLFNLTEGAMKSGETLYQLTTRLRTTTAEASALNKVFSLSGVDANSLPAFLTRLDKSYKNTGKSGEEFRQKLANYGITLTDSNGKLLSTTEQLQQLAIGFENARNAGDEEAFSMEVLGAKGQQLIPVLNQFAEKMEMAKNTKGTGLLDPQQAHEAYLKYQQLQMQIGQLKSAVGASLLPIADDILPELIQGTGDFVDVIKNNKDDIKNAINGWGAVLKGVGSTALEVAEAVGKVANAVNNNALSNAINENASKNNYDEEVLKANGKEIAIAFSQALGGATGAFLGRVGGVKGSAFGAYVGSELTKGLDVTLNRIWADLTGSWSEMEQVYKEKLEAENKAKEATEENTDAQDENSKSARENAEAQKENAEALKERQDATKKLNDEIYELTTSDYDKQIKALNDTIAEAKEKGVDDETISSYYNAKLAKINESIQDSVFKPMSDSFKTELQKSLDEIDAQAKRYKQTAGSALSDEQLNNWVEKRKSEVTAEWDKQVSEQIDSVWQSEFDKQLARIEKEKQAWIKKGLDEVKATQWAENQKKQATNDTIKNMFTSQKKYLDLYRKAMAGQQDFNGYLYNFTQSNEDRQRNAIKMIQAEMMREAGVNPNESTSMAEVQGFQQAMKEAQNWGLNLLKDGSGNGFNSDEIINVLNTNNDNVITVLSQINNEVPSINSNLSSILDTVAQQQQAPQQNINVNPNINVNLGGAYVFDNNMKKQLTDDITNEVSNAVTDAVREATNQINTGYGN